jgi:hypothetical protein
MFAHLDRFLRRRHWLSTLVAFAAMVGQLTVALAPLAEGRESRMASHVESGGAKGHFVHDEAKCVSCQARSMHGTLGRAVVPPIVLVLAPTTVADLAANIQSADLNHQAKPRAPPSLI